MFQHLGLSTNRLTGLETTSFGVQRPIRLRCWSGEQAGGLKQCWWCFRTRSSPVWKHRSRSFLTCLAWGKMQGDSKAGTPPFLGWLWRRRFRRLYWPQVIENGGETSHMRIAWNSSLQGLRPCIENASPKEASQGMTKPKGDQVQDLELHLWVKMNVTE